MNVPDPRAAESVETWDAETDVAVVGFGIAGSCAALEARGTGAAVTVLERASGGGGTTASATGHFYLGGGTPPQLANGIDDDAEQMFRYLMENTPEPEEDKIRLYCDESVAHFQWLTSMGVRFNDGFYRDKHYEQPTDECLIWSGNEKVWPIRERARPAPRGHKVEKPGSGGGAVVIQALTERAEEIGVHFEFDARAERLVVDGDGTILGISWTRLGEEFTLRARGGVVLAAGGFAMNQEMLDEHCPQLADPRIYKQGNPHDDGLGIQLGVSAGGEAILLDHPFVTSPFYPPQSLLKGILVNREGKRFVAEDSYHARSAMACLDQPDGVAYLICDNATFGRPEIGMQELVDAWETIDEMAAALRLPADVLRGTLDAYNDHASRGEDPEFHKHPDWLQPLGEVPWAALDLSLGKATYVGFTLGGLRVSADGEVLRADRSPVCGAYAAGACASNIAQDAAGYSSGTCIGEGSFFGRRAGRHAAGRAA